MKSLSHVRLFATPWTVAYQAPPSVGFSRQEYWGGLPFPSPGDLPNPGIEPGSPALQADALPPEPPGKTAICKACQTAILLFWHFFSMGMVLIPISCTMSRTSIHSSSSTLSDLVPEIYFWLPLYKIQEDIKSTLLLSKPYLQDRH